MFVYYLHKRQIIALGRIIKTIFTSFIALLTALLVSTMSVSTALAAADVSPPILNSVAMVSPQTVYPGDTVSFKWTATDPSPMSHVEF
ncbi:hypothetical protein, partial [Paeniglutamicibacter antarcticus]|uniref:hypothetical protein n=1 Tax=Paeniglutamicibacter antarcticus TaxID=494023 RepID=UPI0031E78444